eukprot:CAMPEP_0198289276 /NCGR_PEP_ID=MMETSP1449-20131203/7516_1 /TAXON_ID=420275 /ORGANISM="Attheya septentrionalis, Strain CCMP2084" /LENGTH=580 /DNA_ID=CAMNT_0043987579 /DNA_START=95 /DNA_END=1837 /DNA_ORIENTATION=+
MNDMGSEERPLKMNFAEGYESAEGNNYQSVSFKPLVRNDSDVVSNTTDEGEPGGEHQTDGLETFLHLLKGYLGAGCLSLPWAVSQLGLSWGCFGIFLMAWWTSYNCWTVVKIKRFILKTQLMRLNADQGDDDVSVESSAASNATSITYPDVGEWAYGKQFGSYVMICICVQQLAICTVFFSFLAENLLAVMVSAGLDTNFLGTHSGVMTMAFPVILSLSFIPTLKGLAPVMAWGTVCLVVGFAALGFIVQQEWSERPEETPSLKLPQFPLAMCAILYSYEGICLILPIESAMKKPEQFKLVFVLAMSLVAIILAVVASLCVLSFGNVTNGSVTAFLLEKYHNDPTITWWLMMANTAVSLSVLLTYPLQLFPALELMGPIMSKRMPRLFKGTPTSFPEDHFNDDLSVFEPLPPLTEHAVHSYGLDETGEDYKEDEDEEEQDENSFSVVTSVTSAAFIGITMQGDSPQLRVTLVLLTYAVALIVPNVQVLISLVGALAGSSTALLIPPFLELAWIRDLENRDQHLSCEVEPSLWMLAPDTSKWGKFWQEKIKCYLLVVMGLIFLVIGTYASISDIVNIYLGK